MKQKTFLPVLILLIMSLCWQCDALRLVKDTPEKVEAEEQRNFYSCSGNEPFWSIKMENEQIIFSSLDGGTTTYPYFEPREIRDLIVFQTRLQIDDATSTLKITLKKEECMDSMSGKKFTYSVKVQKDGKQFSGCASY